MSSFEQLIHFIILCRVSLFFDRKFDVEIYNQIEGLMEDTD